MPVRPVSAIVIGVIEDESAVVVAHLNGSVAGSKVSIVESFHIELPITIPEEVRIALEALEVSRLRSRRRLGLRRRLWRRLRFNSILIVAPLVELDVGDAVNCTITRASGLWALSFALEVGVSTISVIPSGDDVAHVAFNSLAKFVDVVVTVGVEVNLIICLLNSGAECPKSLVVRC